MKNIKRISWILLQTLVIVCGLTFTYFLHQHKLETDRQLKNIFSHKHESNYEPDNSPTAPTDSD